MLVCLLPGITYTAQQAVDSTATYDKLPGAEFNLMLSTIKVVMALGLTLALLIAAIWILKRIIKNRNIPGFSGGALRILEMRFIAPKKSVALVRILDRVLIIGVSDHSLTTLGELTPEEIKLLDIEKIPEPGVFRNILAGITGTKENALR